MITCPLNTALSDRVPEIAKDLVEVVAVARHPGLRAKVAVRARIPGINPVGACVGWGGLRITDIEKRLHGERVSIVAHDNDPATYVRNALGLTAATAEIISTDQRRIRVFVDTDDYRLAVGKAGNNVQLARQLTGWYIEIYTTNRGPDPAPARRPTERLALTHGTGS
ncbi:nucleic acid-binding protein [Mycobacterium intracellulare]|uniref:nucleic acid-binding protein n=1 Tax=Mycobacterium intracellulare TaxID=1767 RepID=UPI001CD9AC94|nr:nucleic acid-binding protein [Mycobacterium intracellulare]MCA2304866.1 nucleic acid-binding protein [Mycobacterium intracellulare]MCA2347103.1 nucleic acid-binding protein [Mycobacterium intracellulare]